MNRSFVKHLKKLEQLERYKRKIKSLILCDPKLPLAYHDFKVDAEVILILPDNGNRGPEEFRFHKDKSKEAARRGMLAYWAKKKEFWP